MIIGFFIRNQMLFAPTFGGWGAFGLYMFARYFILLFQIFQDILANIEFARNFFSPQPF